MAIDTNTYQTYGQVNIREDLSNAIYNVDPYRTPILNMAKKARATQVLHEWNTDTLAAQSLTNAQVEGDTASADALGDTTRLGNYTQISRKVVQISATSQVSNSAGGSSKMGYQLLKAAKELKRDMEGSITNNHAKSAGTSSTARYLAGLPSWLATNTVFNSAGSPAGANPSSTDGTATRTYSGTMQDITEADVKSLAEKMYKNSGESPEWIFCSPSNKQNISAFTGPGTRFTEVQGKKLPTAIDTYQTDFGEVKILPDIFLATSGDVYAFQPQYIRVAYLRPFQTVPLSKDGDSDRKMLIVEYTLEVGNEKAEGAIFDTTG